MEGEEIEGLLFNKLVCRERVKSMLVELCVRHGAAGCVGAGCEGEDGSREQAASEQLPSIYTAAHLRKLSFNVSHAAISSRP